MPHRMVLLKTEKKEELAEVLKKIPLLVGQVPGLIDAEVHEDFGGRSGGYDRMFVLKFDGKRDMDEWAEHEAHIPIRSELRRLAEMIVFDHEA
jgi:antibiotic biosynthesis monooxygenase (ABM) superfamily enzyme